MSSIFDVKDSPYRPWVCTYTINDVSYMSDVVGKRVDGDPVVFGVFVGLV